MKTKKKNILIVAIWISVFSTFVLLSGFPLQWDEDVGWPIFRGDWLLSAGGIPGKLKLLWSFKTGDEIKSSPVIGSGRVSSGPWMEKSTPFHLPMGEKSGSSTPAARSKPSPFS